MQSTRLIEGRSYYRLRYPSHLCPQLTIEGESLAVIDLSEKGLRFSCPSPQQHQIGAVVAATVTFRNGRASMVEGVILRVTTRDVALSLRRGFDFQTVVREQRTLFDKVRYAFH